MKFLFSLLLISLVTFSLSSQAQEISYEKEPAIYDTESTLYISIYGDQIKSTAEIHDLFIKALGFPSSYQKTFSDLEIYLSNPQYTPKQVHITIYSGGLLGYNVGEKAQQDLLEALNNAYEKNYDKDGFKNLTIFYWQ